MKYSEKLKERYIAEIQLWQWQKLRHNAELLPSDGDPRVLEWRNYLGSVLNLYPSGKIYAFWTTNQTARDVIRDNAFNDALESVAESKGAYIYADSDDFFVCWPHEDE